MKDNIMERRAIPDLLDKKYYIPEYQRGYRWEEKQVKELLEDLNTFFAGDTKGHSIAFSLLSSKRQNSTMTNGTRL